MWDYPYQRTYTPTDRSALVTAPTATVLTLDQLKLRAGQDWATGDPRDALMQEYLAAASNRVEQETGLALLTQTRDAYVSAECGLSGVQLGTQCVPVQAVTAVSAIDPSGTFVPLDPASYSVDLARGRIALSSPWWPSVPAVAAPFPGLVVRVRAGWLNPAALAAEAPALVQAVGLLTTHYFTVGRDVVAVGHIVAETPYGYDEALAGFRPVTLI